MIGMGAIILMGVTVGRGSIIGAGTLLPPGKSYPPGTLIMGSPGKVVRDLTPEEIAGIREDARSYWEKARGHLKQR
jgi:carbonic anhydrase/acetyltransferase-like protein (isoleucine patch superfamily)